MKPPVHRFEAIVLPHLDAAYNLARWLVRDEHAAEDVVQEAYLRALRYFDAFRGSEIGEARSWLLGIVRNTSYTWLKNAKRSRSTVEFDDGVELDIADASDLPIGRVENPEAIFSSKVERNEINSAIRALPMSFREVLILREIEEMPYESIAKIMQIPVGTVMSRLSRARSLLRVALEATFRASSYES